MGPRSFERGNLGVHRVFVYQRLSFNGAALIRARKYGRSNGARKSGEASMGPRSFERGNSIPVSAPGWRCCRASMGPRSFERGNPPPRPRSPSNIDALQWGRAHSSAEIGQRPIRPKNCGPRFNGAALIRARKYCYPALHPRLPLLQLQWGRAHSSAEIGH